MLPVSCAESAGVTLHPGGVELLNNFSKKFNYDCIGKHLLSVNLKLNKFSNVGKGKIPLAKRWSEN